MSLALLNTQLLHAKSISRTYDPTYGTAYTYVKSAFPGIIFQHDAGDVQSQELIDNSNDILKRFHEITLQIEYSVWLFNKIIQ